LAALILAAVGSACGSSPTGVGAEVPYDWAFDDEPGDTVVATTNPDNVKAIDLLGVSGRFDLDRLTVTLEFAEPIARWSDDQPNSLDGFIFLDINQDPSSGRKPAGNPDVGADVYLDLRDDGSGRAGLVNVAQQKLTLIKPRWEGTRFVAEIERALLTVGSDNNNRLNLYAEVGARGRSPSSDGSPATFHRLEPPP
jgi:hypothetical protein